MTSSSRSPSGGTSEIQAPVSEWHSGWRLLVACYLGAMLAAIPLNTVGVFMPALHREFGWSQAEMSLIVPLNSWLIALTSPFMGSLVDRYGCRIFGLVGALGLSLAIAAMSLMTPSIYSYWAGWGLIGVAGVFGSILFWTIPIARHFAVNRGTALAITLLGSSTTGILYAPLASLGIEHWDWRWAYMATGIGGGIIIVPVIFLFFRDPVPHVDQPAAHDFSQGEVSPHDDLVPAGLTLGEAVRTHHFWILTLSILLGAGTSIALFILMIPIARSLGMTPLQSAAMVSAIGIGSVVSKLVLGPVIDRTRSSPLCALTLMAPMATCLAFLLIHPLPFAGAFAASMLIGIATGLELDMIAVMTARYFGMRHFGKVYGVMQAAFQVAAGGGAAVLGLGHDMTGDYRTSLMIAVGLLMFAAALLLVMGREPFHRAHRSA